MAGKTFPLDFILGLKDNASPALKKSVSRMQKAAAGFGDLGAKLTRNVTAPLAAMGVGSVMAASNFEDGMAKISTLVDTTTENMSAMSDQVLAIGKRTPVALSDLTSALYDVRSAGITADQQFNVLEQSARLGVAGLGTTAEAVDLVTSAVNSWQMSGEETARTYNTIFQTVKSGKTTISALAQGFGSVAGTVADNGVAFDEYLSSVAAMTTTGLKASEAHTQLRAVFAGLTREGGSAGKIFKKLGAKTFKDLIAQSGGLVPALNKIRAEVGGDDKELLKMLGSTEALNAVIGLTGPVADKQREALENMRSGVDEVGIAFDKRAQDQANKLRVMRNQLEATSIQIGNRLVPVVERLTGVLEGLIGKWDSLSDSEKDTALKLAGFAMALGPAATAISKFSSALALLQANPGLLVLGAVAFSAVTIYREWDRIPGFFQGLWEDIIGYFTEGWNSISGIIVKLVNAARVISNPLGAISVLGGAAVDKFYDLGTGQAVNASERAAAAKRSSGEAGKNTVQVGIQVGNAPPGTTATVTDSGGVPTELLVGRTMTGASL